MRFVPSYKLNILSEENYAESMHNISKQLEEVRISGKFKSFDGVNLHYEYFLAENSKGNLVIVHGLSEFTLKFYELIYYSLNLGFNVFIYDQRCHGLSDRLTPHRDLLHVRKFKDYVKDLSSFIDKIVLPAENKPIYLFAHSMGGGVAALYLAQQDKNSVEKAVLSAPMFEPIVENVSFNMARFSVNIGKIIFGTKNKFFNSKEFNPEVTFKNIKGLSKARFEYNINLRRENENYQTTPMSFGWVSGSLNISKKILSKKVTEKIKTPILIISANYDEMVNNKPQKEFYNKCKTCSFKNIENATHAILASDNDILSRVLDETFNFFS